jgi:tetratricopeptide (TPR) repeat protein
MTPQELIEQGLSHHQAGRRAEAIDLLKRALALNPNSPDIHALIGHVLVEMDQLDQAIEHLQKAVALRPDFADAHANLSVALLRSGRPARAVDAARASLALRDNPTARFNLGFALLLLGELRQGWREYLWRWRSPELNAAHSNRQPQWDGSQLAGRTLLVHCEQGLGDTIQFVRYVPLIAARQSQTRQGGEIVLECQPSLKSLLANLPGAAAVIAKGETLPPCDLQCPMMTLPMLMDTTLQSIPADKPYLYADQTLAQQWQRRIATGCGSRTVSKVGLAWAGRPSHPDDHHRSIPLADLGSLAQVSGIRWFSLQKGPRATDAAAGSFPLTDWTRDLADFADTAALIANLDLVLTVDTSLAHLAGALGKPVWVLLPYAPDWRWLLDRADSPWYPTMRLFRQATLNNWRDPIAAAALALSSLSRL